MVVRPGKTSDIQSVLRLLTQMGYNDNDREHVNRMLQQLDPCYHILVAETDHDVIGFVSLHWFDMLHLSGKIGRITSFCVDEQNRSQGVGASMLRHAEEFLKKKGCVKIEVTSNQRRTRAHQFYLNHGYTEDSRRFIKKF